MEITSVLMQNYLPYAKGTIIDRAIPFIDGLKPSQRKILYTMYTMGLLKGGKTKSANIVGATMRLHPHGDITIYDTMVRLATGNETLNVPYVESKGNFGKVYSKDLAYAASRYTEAKLAPICNEIFDGIEEDAVEFEPNYDETMMEPTVLPVKFPNILTNPSSGIAVGMGSSIPPFGLNNVCESVIGILEGKITNCEELVNVLGIPEFSTGGNIHTTKEDMIKFLETGKGSFVISGTAVTYQSSIVITEIPYNTTSEAIVDAIENYVKSGELKEVTGVSDETGFNGFKLVVNLRKGANPQAVLNKLMRLTPLRTKISFSTEVISDERCQNIDILTLLMLWIKFRVDCINRQYTFRYNKASKKEHILASWEKIKDDLDGVHAILSKKGLKEADALAILMQKYDLDEEQGKYVLDMRLRDIVEENMNKHLKELKDIREEMAGYKNVIDSDKEKCRIIIEDQNRIIKKYGKNNKTKLGAPIVEDNDKEEVEVVDDSGVIVVLTESGYLKRLVTTQSMAYYEVPEGETEKARFSAKNNGHMLVFTYDGTVYKILVNNIDASRGKMKDSVAEIIGVNSNDIMLIDYAGDYTKHFNLVYPNGRGVRVEYARAKGNRSKYKGLFDASKPGTVCWTFEDKFFLVTHQRKASWCDLTNLGVFNNRTAFKVARISSGDSIFALQDAKNVPDMSKIDLEKYNKEYTVLIGEDDLWEGAREKYLEAMEAREKAKEMASAEKARLKAEAKEAKRQKRRQSAMKNA